eukprot:gene21096-20881_t
MSVLAAASDIAERGWAGGAAKPQNAQLAAAVWAGSAASRAAAARAVARMARGPMRGGDG